ncbi:uncharacterized protein SPPG_05985 [Spizellomyces punctatus DAOM BR117]|uniref:Oxidized purine nucleoside triphosphate hydrolase n=1 Tax=Spizellomyces punctatus (strain DAOM BR117) TaxID=645134 RepID=A0A0L0HBS4_SPIPD|nr:uncharacterized protein SPPG_05985 [Spizellomyces punctatus DAOM BR117]KNC99035.1 hypothetical protein SPPG_05985 [Spizellomyces punctatus DAOM BR117]|eukprot:XP_016607075.1 hypothetical protein SPPG_05985 [Spizellomyces punctatus DAOM BR117]
MLAMETSPITSKKVLTLVFVFGDFDGERRVLLGMKKRGFGAGYWNGFGGKVEKGETILEGAVRELEEEAGIRVSHLERAGMLWFHFEGDPTGLEVHVYRGETFEGVVSETEEMRPEWFSLDKIPFHIMWPDDQIWWPVFVGNKKFCGRFRFAKDQKEILAHDVGIFESLPCEMEFGSGEWVGGVLVER